MSAKDDERKAHRMKVLRSLEAAIERIKNEKQTDANADMLEAYEAWQRQILHWETRL